MGLRLLYNLELIIMEFGDLPKDSGLERIGHIEMIEDLQKKGVGQNYVNSLKTLRKAQGRDTIDIIAKPGSEGFWKKQGFQTLNLDEYVELYMDESKGRDDFIFNIGKLFFVIIKRNTLFKFNKTQ